MKTCNIKVSVVVPVYNGEKTITKAIESILNQTYEVTEIIIVDNNSNDTTALVLEKANFPKVKVLSCFDKGVAYARNKGVRHSKGNWIAFLDSDDEWLSNKLELQINAINNSQTQLGFVATRTNQSKPILDNEFISFNSLLKGNKITTSSLMVSSELCKQIGEKLFCERSGFAEDWGAWLKIAYLSPGILLSTPLVNYNVEPYSKYSYEKVDNGLNESFQDVVVFLKERKARRDEFKGVYDMIHIQNFKQKIKYNGFYDSLKYLLSTFPYIPSSVCILKVILKHYVNKNK